MTHRNIIKILKKQGFLKKWFTTDLEKFEGSITYKVEIMPPFKLIAIYVGFSGNDLDTYEVDVANYSVLSMDNLLNMIDKLKCKVKLNNYN